MLLLDTSGVWSTPAFLRLVEMLHPFVSPKFQAANRFALSPELL